MPSSSRGPVSRRPDSAKSRASARAPAGPAVRSAPPVQWAADAWITALQAPLGALGLTLTADQQAQLARYMVMLQHWNATYNLTALRDAPDMLTHHLADCLAVLPPLLNHVRARVASGAPTPMRLLDVGSGGGLPGVVLAICCEGLQVTCVDTVGKKAAFIRQVAAELRLGSLRAEHARVEQLRTSFDLVTSRAFASLNDFVSLTRELLAPEGVWMAMKGKQPDDEVAALPAGIDVFHVEPLQVPGLDADRCLVWMRPEGAV